MASANFLLQQLIELSRAANWKMATARGKTGLPKLAARAPHESAQRSSLLKCIAERRARGETFASIAAMLNERGLRGRNGARWYSASVREYLKRNT
jgi:predicted mannosyl-3-phosphoglycerate phosphatase (HAD superfamily)